MGGGCYAKRGGRGNFQASFVQEVNLPGRSEVLPSQTLIKTWQLQNSGSAAWPPGTKLMYVRGNLPSLENAFEIAESVAAGQTVNVSAVVRTPTQPGRHRALFRLVDPAGAKFGPRLWCDLLVQQGAPRQAPLPSAVQSDPSVSVSAPEPPPPPPGYTALAEPATGAAVEPTSEPTSASAVGGSPDQQYQVQMEALQAMGWDNEELNLYLLRENNGNVQRVCNWLLEQMKD